MLTAKYRAGISARHGAVCARLRRLARWVMVLWVLCWPVAQVAAHIASIEIGSPHAVAGENVLGLETTVPIGQSPAELADGDTLALEEVRGDTTPSVALRTCRLPATVPEQLKLTRNPIRSPRDASDSILVFRRLLL